MTTARVRELRDLGDEELVERLDSSKEELFNLRFQLATGQLDNPMRIKDVRREVARILTILRERDLQAQSEPPAGRDEVAEGEPSVPRRRFARRRSAGQESGRDEEER